MFKNDKKDKLIQIKVTAKQKDKIIDFANKNNMKISEFILSLLEDYFQKKQ